MGFVYTTDQNKGLPLLDHCPSNSCHQILSVEAFEQEVLLAPFWFSYVVYPPIGSFNYFFRN